MVQYNWIWLMVVAKGTQVAHLFNLVHEFGHALGFAHEWVRPGYDFPAGCTQNEDAPNQPGFAITPWIDHKSIMDKCQSATGIYGLSAGDIIGVQQAYGRMASGSLVGYNGLCAGPAAAPPRSRRSPKRLVAISPTSCGPAARRRSGSRLTSTRAPRAV